MINHTVLRQGTKNHVLRSWGIWLSLFCMSNQRTSTNETKVTTPSKSPLLKLNKEFREKALTIHGLLAIVRA